MSSLYKAMLLGAPLLAGIFIGGSSDISNFAFGKEIREDSAKIIPWVSFAITVGCFKSYFLDISFQLAKATRIQLYITIGMAAINVVLNLLLMPIFGVVGAAASTAIAFTVGAVLSWWFGRNLGVYPSQKLDAVKILLVLSVIVLAMNHAPFGSGATLIEAITRFTIGVIAYVVSAFILNLANIRSIMISKAKKLHRKNFHD